ncbi:MAG: Rne/Rng family ribonuclease [Bacteroidales bacterium]|nr:Rne/Rng family ribonuclease [Bacteroidales bacterium]
MSKEIIIRGRDKNVDIALLEDSKLLEYVSSENNIDFAVGDIYLAKIKKVIPSLNAVFVDLGYEHAAFLHYNDLGPNFQSLKTVLKNIIAGKNIPKFTQIELLPEIDKEGVVSDLLHIGDPILVQVAKEPISTKGPKLCSEISLAGRNVILLPFSNKISISQKIESGDEKNRLRKITKSFIPNNYGAIIRTAASGCDVSVLEKEISELVAKWEKILAKIREVRNKTPYLVQREVDRVSSLLRDVYNPSYSDIIVDDKSLFEEVKAYISSIAPEYEKTVRLYSAGPPIYEQYGVEKQIKSSFGKTVPVKSGAYLIIEKTEALHVIDVNSGNRTKADKNQESNAIEVNIASAIEIARQIRLRDLGGIVIVDFIDMKENDNKVKLYETMKEAMADDRAKHNILPLSKFGLMQITRQRVRPELKINTNETCPTCKGTGVISPSINFVQEVECELAYIRENTEHKKINVRVHPFIASHLKKGLISIELRWKFKYGLGVNVVPSNENTYLEYKFTTNDHEEIIY